MRWVRRYADSRKQRSRKVLFVPKHDLRELTCYPQKHCMLILQKNCSTLVEKFKFADTDKRCKVYAAATALRTYKYNQNFGLMFGVWPIFLRKRVFEWSLTTTAARVYFTKRASFSVTKSIKFFVWSLLEDALHRLSLWCSCLGNSTKYCTAHLTLMCGILLHPC